MAFFRVCTALLCVAIVSCNPANQQSFWKGTALDSAVEEMRSLCANDDAIACLKFKVFNFLDNLFQKDTYQLSDNVEINRNTYRANEVTSRSDGGSIGDTVEDYVKTHDVTFKFPFIDSSITLATKNLDKDELDLNVKFSNDVQARGKSKLKKIMIPIFIFVLLKAITLIPLALGILGLKAWNAVQLSFFSFVVSIALAVFQLCKKIAADNAHPPIVAHGPWEAYSTQYKRSMDVGNEAPQMAYNSYLVQ